MTGPSGKVAGRVPHTGRQILIRSRSPKDAGPIRSALVVVVTSLALASLLVGCGSTSSADKATEQQKAEQLVAAAQASGVAPHLTVGAAKALYGTDAATVCKAFHGGLSTAEKNNILGNPGDRRAKTITTKAVTFGRLVVQTYCPAELSHYKAAVANLNSLTSTR
jgi:hypothetical protein